MDQTVTIPKTFKQKLKGSFMTILIMASMFLIVPTFFLQRSFAATPVYSVHNTIWINATGINVSAAGESIGFPIKIVVSQSIDSDGMLHASAYSEENDTGSNPFAPDSTQHYILMKDITANIFNPYNRPILTRPDLVVTPSTERYFSFSYYNGSTMLCDAKGYLQTKGIYPATATGASVQERTIIFECPQELARLYCDGEGYSFLNVINSTYERSVNFEALNIWRSEFLTEEIFIIESETELNETIVDSEISQRDLRVLYTIFRTKSVAAGMLVPDVQAPQMMELDPPNEEAEAIADMVANATDFWMDYIDQITDAYINGTLPLDVYIYLMEYAGDSVNNVTEMGILDVANLFSLYTNGSKYLYDAYSDNYALYAAAFQATWTDWITTILVIVIVIIVIVIIYKILTRKKVPSSSVPQMIVVK